MAQEDQKSVPGADGQGVVTREGEGSFVITRLVRDAISDQTFVIEQLVQFIHGTR